MSNEDPPPPPPPMPDTWLCDAPGCGATFTSYDVYWRHMQSHER